MRGRGRATRHSAEYYTEMRENKLAVYVKICDTIANVTYSLLTGSTMFKKYRDEYPRFKSYLYCDGYKEMFDYLEKLLGYDIAK